MLTKEFILEKTNEKELDKIKKLNIWGEDIENIDIISEMKSLEVISLSVNKITTLKPFESLVNLKELYLRNNKIEDFEEINYLKNCKNLKTLWLEDNPIFFMDNYRQIVINKLPQINLLDNKPIDESEKKDSQIQNNDESIKETKEEEESKIKENNTNDNTNNLIDSKSDIYKSTIIKEDEKLKDKNGENDRLVNKILAEFNTTESNNNTNMDNSNIISNNNFNVYRNNNENTINYLNNLESQDALNNKQLSSIDDIQKYFNNNSNNNNQNMLKISNVNNLYNNNIPSDSKINRILSGKDVLLNNSTYINKERTKTPNSGYLRNSLPNNYSEETNEEFDYVRNNQINPFDYYNYNNEEKGREFNNEVRSINFKHNNKINAIINLLNDLSLENLLHVSNMINKQLKQK